MSSEAPRTRSQLVRAGYMIAPRSMFGELELAISNVPRPELHHRRCKLYGALRRGRRYWVPAHVGRAFVLLHEDKKHIRWVGMRESLCAAHLAYKKGPSWVDALETACWLGDHAAVRDLVSVHQVFARD